MDLEEILHQHQVTAIKAGLSGHESQRQSHFDQVAICARRLRELRNAAAKSNRMADD